LIAQPTHPTSRFDIEDAFNRIGRVRDVWVARKPPGFAFVEMEDRRDAQDAVRELDGTRLCGNRCKVEMSNGGKGGRFGRSRSRSPRRRSPVRRSRSRSRRRRSPSYRSMSRERGGGRSRSRSPAKKRRDSRSRSRSPAPKRADSKSRSRLVVFVQQNC